jgi:uncharacterized protein (TIGR03083 family)
MTHDAGRNLGQAACGGLPGAPEAFLREGLKDMAGNGREPVKTGDGWTAVSSGAAYASVQRNLLDLLREIKGSGESLVPACPGWSVRDAVVHLLVICRDAEARLDPGPGGRSGLAADGLRELGLSSLLDEWERSGVVVESALTRAENSHKGAVLVMDAFTHELDISLALGVVPPVDHPAFRGAFEVAVGGLSGSVMARGLPPFLLETDDGTWIAGDGEPVAVARGSRMELYRSITGRRTYEQIRQVTWSAEPGPWLPAFCWGPFRPPATPVE